MSSQKKEVKLLDPMVLEDAPVWHHCLGFHHFHVDVDICIDIYWNKDFPTKVKVCASFNGHRGCYSIDVADVACIPIEIPEIPVGFKICFDNWHITSDEISFDITLEACAIFCFTVFSYKVIIPTTAINKYRAGALSEKESQMLLKALAINTPKYFNNGQSSACNCS